MSAPRRRRTPSRLLAGLSALLLLGLGACSSDTSGSAGSAGGSGSAAPSGSASASGSAGESASGAPAPSYSPSGAVPAAGSFPTYVALGDSYTAAPLAGPTDQADPCLRSSVNYPALVAQVLGDGLVDVSCSGADTTSLIGVQQVNGATLPAQFDALQPDTSLVTIGIGGNDFGIFSNLVGTCTQLAAQDPEGAPCQAQNTAGGSDALLADVRKLGDRLTAVVAGILDRSPDATIVVVGYPASVPTEGTCPDLLPLAAGDYDYAASINKALAATQKKAAEAAGVIYIDTWQASLTHDICSDDPWINGQTTSASTALAYHPLVAEQQAVADMILAALADAPAGQGASN